MEKVAIASGKTYAAAGLILQSLYILLYKSKQIRYINYKCRNIRKEVRNL